MRIGLISCTKSKTPNAAPARELYAPSALFRGALSYLEGRADEIYVLSAKYGLMALDQKGEPYDLTLKAMPQAERRRWARRVLEQIQAKHGTSLHGVTFEFHTGNAYRADLEDLLWDSGAECNSPVTGLAIGERLSFYSGRRQEAVFMATGANKEVRRVSVGASGSKQGKIHAHVWLAAALLHEAGHPSFGPARLVEEVERQFGDTRPGVKTHVHAHCVATAPLNAPTIYNYLVRLETGELRLSRPGDQVHRSREGGKTAPLQTDVPEKSWEIWRRWATGR